MSLFAHPPPEPQKLSGNWQRNFPVYPKGVGVNAHALLTFGKSVCIHCINHGIYFPPLHTVNNTEPCGWWYPELPPAVQGLVHGLWSTNLLQRFQDVKTGLTENAAMRALVNNAASPYLAFLQLMQLAEHPHTVEFHERREYPTQRSVQSINEISCSMV